VTAPAEAAAPGQQQPYDGQDSAAELLRLAGHIGSTVAAGNPAWLAAVDGRWSPIEDWLRADLAARRAARLRAEADRSANAALSPGEYLPAPSRTTGPMAAPPADEAETILPGDVPALDERTEAALDAFNDLHDSMPDETAALSVTEAPEPGRHGKRRRWLR